MTDKRKDNLKNLGGHKFPNAPQGLDEKKSKGQVDLSSNRNIRLALETKLFDKKAVDLVVEDALEQLEKGNGAPLRELIKIAKGNETQNINLNGGVEVQKIFIDEKTKQETKKHIKEFIDD